MHDSLLLKIDDAFDRFVESGKFGKAIAVGNEIYNNHCDASEDNLLKARVYTLLGISYSMAGSDSLSLDYLMKSRDVSVKMKDTLLIVGALNNLGVNYRNIGDLKTSNSYFKRTVELIEQKNLTGELVYSYFNIGLNLISNDDEADNDYKKSLAYFKKVETLTTQYHKEKSIVVELYEKMSAVYHKLGNSQKAAEYYDKGVQFAKKYGYLKVLAQLHFNKAIIKKEKKDFEKAYYYLEEHISVQDSVHYIEEFEKAKQIEAENFLRENALKLKLIEKEKEMQDMVIAKSKTYNHIFIGLIALLLIFAFWVYKKNKALRKAKDKAERLSKVKSDFYSEISHELRTPLYAVIELSGILLKENVNDAHKEYLESLKFSGNHLLSLINNVLELNKAESGKIQIETYDINIKQLISSIVDSLEYALRDSNNTIKLKYDDDIPNELVGDSLKLSQVLINLISNAIKFTNNGTIDVVIKKLEDIDGKVKVYFMVSDNGVGIPLEKQKQIFEDFHQEHTEYSKTYKGTGLGLSIVKRILKAMGAEINLISKENKGATFFFELTFEKKNVEPKEIPVYENQLKRIQNCTFLIVDDNKINQLVTQKVLEQLQVKSMTADSGTEALEMLKHHDFDCVLMDLNMPGMDGFETTTSIRTFNTGIPIVALTAASSNETILKIGNCEMNGYILKPFAIKDFINTIIKAMNKENPKKAFA